METATAGTVPFEHDGLDWAIPRDLIDAQVEWDRAHAACTRLADGGDRAQYERMRTRRLGITLYLHRHPWLIDHMAAGRRHQADQALKACARVSDPTFGPQA
jgi:hypothetical protein